MVTRNLTELGALNSMTDTTCPAGQEQRPPCAAKGEGVPRLQDQLLTPS